MPAITHYTYPDGATCNYRAGELAQVRTGADTNYMPSIVLRSDSGQTRHLARLCLMARRRNRWNRIMPASAILTSLGK